MEKASGSGQEQDCKRQNCGSDEKPEHYQEDFGCWRPDAEDLLTLGTPNAPGSTGITKDHCPDASEEKQAEIE